MIRHELRSGHIVLLDDEDAGLLNRPWTYAKSTGYVVGCGRGKQHVYMHRVILGLTKGDELHADHINRDKLDNRRSNLRLVTHAENMQNRPFPGEYRGITYVASRGKWEARGKLNYRPWYLGHHDSQIDAAKAAEAFRREHMPFAERDDRLDPVGPCPCKACRVVVLQPALDLAA